LGVIVHSARVGEDAADSWRKPRATRAPLPRTAAAHAGIDRREEAEHEERAELEPEHGVPHLVLRPAGEIVERRPGEIEELVGGLASDDDGSQEADDVRRRDVSAKRPAQSAPAIDDLALGENPEPAPAVALDEDDLAQDGDIDRPLERVPRAIGALDDHVDGASLPSEERDDLARVAEIVSAKSDRERLLLQRDSVRLRSDASPRAKGTVRQAVLGPSALGRPAPDRSLTKASRHPAGTSTLRHLACRGRLIATARRRGRAVEIE